MGTVQINLTDIDLRQIIANYLNNKLEQDIHPCKVVIMVVPNDKDPGPWVNIKDIRATISVNLK